MCSGVCWMWAVRAVRGQTWRHARRSGSESNQRLSRAMSHSRQTSHAYTFTALCIACARRRPHRASRSVPDDAMRCEGCETRCCECVTGLRLDAMARM
eukprot:3842568-Rhodomonas_salina.1